MEGSTLSYKLMQEKFVSNHTGSSIWEPLSLIVPYPLLVFFMSFIVDVCALPRLSIYSFLLEFIIFVSPMVLMFTVLDYLDHIFAFIVVFSFVGVLFYIFRKRNRRLLKITLSLVLSSEKRPFISYFRSIGILTSAFCILAVDFPIFPRRFSKTESYGFGFMDIGVGFYTISNGLVTKPVPKEHLAKSLKSSVPIIILGIIRCVSVNILDYQKHVSEYGVYWNFFFTLAVVKLAGPLLLAKWPNGALWTSIALAVMHQSALSSGIEDWIINDASREDILSANKEGFISLPGYLSLYMSAVYIGSVLQNNIIEIKTDISRTLKFFALSVLFFILTFVFYERFNVSRRLVNITYITWLLALSFLLLTLTITVEMSLRIFFFVDGRSKKESIIPLLIDAINYNGLIFFLIANLLTGIINLCLKTLYMTPLYSILILSIYMLFICFVICFMYRYKIKLL